MLLRIVTKTELQQTLYPAYKRLASNITSFLRNNSPTQPSVPSPPFTHLSMCIQNIMSINLRLMRFCPLQVNASSVAKIRVKIVAIPLPREKWNDYSIFSTLFEDNTISRICITIIYI